MWWKGRSCQAQVKLLEEMNLQQSSGHYGHVQSCKMISAPFEGTTSLWLLSSLCHLMSPLPAGPLLVLGNERGLFSLLVLSHSDEACTCGQLVVASRESQYKIFHFHHGGLDKLSEVFQQWKYCTETHLKDQVPGQVHEVVYRRCFTLRFSASRRCWRNEAASSRHRVRQKATTCWRLLGCSCKSDVRSLLYSLILLHSCSACGIWGKISQKTRLGSYFARYGNQTGQRCALGM